MLFNETDKHSPEETQPFHLKFHFQPDTAVALEPLLFVGTLVFHFLSLLLSAMLNSMRREDRRETVC